MAAPPLPPIQSASEIAKSCVNMKEFILTISSCSTSSPLPAAPTVYPALSTPTAASAPAAAGSLQLAAAPTVDLTLSTPTAAAAPAATHRVNGKTGAVASYPLRSRGKSGETPLQPSALGRKTREQAKPTGAPLDRGARATKAEDGKGVDPAKSVDAPAEKKVRATTAEGGGDDVGGVQDGGEGGAGVAGEGDGSAFGGDGRDVVAAPAAGAGAAVRPPRAGFSNQHAFKAAMSTSTSLFMMRQGGRV